jgi:hypothetical protein
MARTKWSWKEVGHDDGEYRCRTQTRCHGIAPQGPARIVDLTPDEIALILDTAEAMKEVGTRPIKKCRRCAARPW